MNPNELNALIALLDDDDREVLENVWNRIKSYGEEVIPHLENAWTADFNVKQSERLEEIIHEIQYESLLEQIDQWQNSPTPDLLLGYFLVSKYFYPNIHFEVIERKVMRIRQSIWLELNSNQTPFEQIQIFNQVLYYHLGFKGEQEASQNEDFCLNHVLESKKGNPISLGILYIVLARSLNLPVFGVCLVNYFILAFCRSEQIDFDEDEELQKQVLFYLNPFQKGVIFSKNQIDDYLKRMDTKQNSLYYSPADTIRVIKEMLHYLIVINEQKKEMDVVADLREIAGRIQ